ncbi:MAG: twin-arginine translocase TatA/TatE family subunit [Rhodospirillales bacterium]|nr:twin-arginine translocase TatA/TatE family subunit [Rhodospirillales bacterium]MCB9965885.1 twin-arginine translocase TatA/TatE family subunit [Rhodospirillales bacterium]MCB9973649.1 twin-arginine translocase TatA/TatE family subunit [Rhodospirillales bacterium]
MAPSIWQILIIVIAVVLLFGAGRLPQIMGDLAKGVQSFKKGLKEEDDEKKKENNPE